MYILFLRRKKGRQAARGVESITWVVNTDRDSDVVIYPFQFRSCMRGGTGYSVRQDSKDTQPG